MGAFVARQPNGLLCLFSTIVDTITHYNMTFEDYVVDIQMCKYGKNRKDAEMEAKEVVNHRIRPFQDVIDRFVPNNQTKEEFYVMLKEMGYNE